MASILFPRREKSARFSQSTGDVGSAAADERDFGRSSVGWQLAVAARLAGHRGGGAAGRQLRRACGCLVFGGAKRCVPMLAISDAD